ncbi:MAG: DUF4012 domain-containing protein [Anaerolineales bacterium]
MSIKRQHIVWGGIGLLAIALVALGIWGFNVYRTVSSLTGYLPEVQALADDPLAADPVAVGEILHGARADVQRLDRLVGWAAPLGRAFGWLPKVGPLAADAPELLTLADALSEVGVLMWDDVAPALAEIQAGTPAMEAMTVALPRLAEDLDAARITLERAQAAYAALDLAAMPEELRAPLEKLGQMLPLLADGLDWIEVAPELLGLESFDGIEESGAAGERTYLLLALNEDELRPGGGFISAVGEIHLRAGQIISMTFNDSYQVDDFSQPYPDAPDPLRQFMAIELLVFRDSNWSPDFPTWVSEALPLYRPGYEVQADGVVAVDQAAVRALIDAVGPLTLPGGEAPITGETLLAYMYTSWAPDDGDQSGDWWRNRKSFMRPLAEAALARVQSGKIDVMELLTTAERLIAERHLQMYFVHLQAQALLVERGWDGGVDVPDGDFLAVIEANIGYNKASAKIDRAFTYEVDLTQTPPRATATLTFTHTSQADVTCRMAPRYDDEYQQMMDRCYWAYVRLFVPEGARLLSASEHPIPAEMMGSGEPWSGAARVAPTSIPGMTAFAQAFLMRPANQTVLRFSYELPASVLQQTEEGTVYRLRWQKQPGMQGAPIRVILRVPRNAVLWHLHSEPATTDAGQMVYDLDLNIDQQIGLRYKPED